MGVAAYMQMLKPSSDEVPSGETYHRLLVAWPDPAARREGVQAAMTK